MNPEDLNWLDGIRKLWDPKATACGDYLEAVNDCRWLIQKLDLHRKIAEAASTLFKLPRDEDDYPEGENPYEICELYRIKLMQALKEAGYE